MAITVSARTDSLSTTSQAVFPRGSFQGRDSAPAEVLRQARERASVSGQKHAGGLHPREAWALVETGEALLVDVRTAEERKFVGHVPGSLHVPWMTGAALVRNPRFLQQLAKAVPTSKDAVLLFLCRSGRRSAAAAQAATAAGYANAFHVLEGFEGELSEKGHRGEDGTGWRQYGLPWVQD